MKISSLPLQLMHNIGFANMMLLAVFLGSLALLWLVLSLPGRRVWKVLLGALCVAGVGMMFTISPLRHMGTEFSTPVVKILCLGTSLVMLLMLVQMGRLALMLPAALLALVWRRPWRILASRRCSQILAVLGLLLGCLGYWNTIRVPQVREVSISIPHLAPELEGFRLVQLTDLHLGTIFDQAWMNSVVNKVNALQADAVLITGDVGEAAPAHIQSALEPLKRLQAADGVFYALGNHETYQGTKEWVAWYQANGTLLRDSHVLLHRGNAALTLAGTDDRQPNPKAALQGTPRPRILLSHRPSTAPDNARYGVDLQLSGHTHGGLFPVLQSIVAAGNRGYVSGLYQVGKMWLYVSNGTGLWSYVAIRLNVPAEITLLRLTKAP